SHVQKGYEMVIGNLDASAAIVVLDHHQSWDGHGFPEHGHFGAEPAPRHGHDIHVFARIVAAADAYDRLLHRVDGGTWPRVRAMNTLLNSPLNGRFDPVVLAVMPVVAPPYPPGSQITLSDGQRAFVLDWDAEAPCRPVVVPMKDPKDGMPPNADGHDAPAESIDLRVRPDLLIVEQDGQDVAADNFEFAYRKALLDARSRSDACGDVQPTSPPGSLERAA
ncbi:MAG: hypothetical protein KDA22_05970, partial [Phycisphaerales bacterium]|nr:hypothetical protein [Phycisphaerales bacterium]